MPKGKQLSQLADGPKVPRVFAMIAAWLIVFRCWCQAKAGKKDFRPLADQAQTILDEALRDNTLGRATKPDLVERYILRSGSSPLCFALKVGAACLALACIFLPAPYPSWAVIPSPRLPNDYTHAGFFGAVWSVQATMVALVYPIVLTFITIMLQRRATSKVALNVYLLDSAVLPAGTSSLVLLVAMSVEYLFSVYAPRSLVLFAIVFNGSWLIANVIFTGYFLARTVRYVEDQVGQTAYRRLAVNTVLREELVGSLCEHLLAGAPERLHWSARTALSSGEPSVTFFSLRDGTALVSRKLTREKVLTNVRLGALTWVASRWVVRSRTLAHLRARESGRELECPTLKLRAGLNEPALGTIELCSVTEDFASLSLLEIAVLRRAYVFRDIPNRLMSYSTIDMLEELAAEVRSLNESRRFTAGQEALANLLKLHCALLTACDEGSQGKDAPTSAASLQTSPYAWGARNYNTEWQKPYRTLTQLAVRQFAEDDDLFGSLAFAASNLIRDSELQPPSLIAELFVLPRLLDHALAQSWSREMQRAGINTATAARSALPQPFSQDYQDAIIRLLGGIHSFRYVERRSEDEASAWRARCNAAQSFASHIELSANLLLSAVGRGDAVAAQWYGDNFIAWWENHSFDLDYGQQVDYEEGLEDVRLGITELAWPQAHRHLSEVFPRRLTHQHALEVVWHTVRRYWESMRLVVVLLLLEQAQGGTHQELALALAARILRRQVVNRGVNTSGLELVDPDAVLALFVELCEFDDYSRQRLFGFCERHAHWTDTTPMVPGWLYSGSGRNSPVERKLEPLAQIIVACVTDDSGRWRASLELLNRANINLRKLQTVGELAESTLRTLRRKTFRAFYPVAMALRADIGMATALPRERKYAAHGLIRLRAAARERRRKGLEELVVDPRAVRAFVEQLSHAFLAEGTQLPVQSFYAVATGPHSKGEPFKRRGIPLAVEQLVIPRLTPIWKGDIEAWAKRFVGETVTESVHRVLAERNAKPIPHLDDASLLAGVVSAANAISTSGLTPVIIPGPARERGSYALQPHRWQRAGHEALPAGFNLEYQAPKRLKYASAYLICTPILHMHMPEGVFVVPLEWMATLVFEVSAAGSIVAATYSVPRVNEVKVDVTWRAHFEEGRLGR